MAIGDDALAAGMTLVNGAATGSAAQIDDYINETRDEVARRTSAVLPITKGGTGATTAAAARTNLGAAPTSHSHLIGNIYASDGVTPYATALQAALDIMSANTSARVAKAGDTMSGHLYLPNSVAANVSWTVAYIDGDGRVSRGASSERYKDDIHPLDPAELGDIFPVLHEFVMRGDTGRRQHVGYIAERLNESDDLRRFVVYARETLYDDDGNVTGSRLIRDEDGNPVPESIDFIALLLAQVARLHQRVQQLEDTAVTTPEGE